MEYKFICPCCHTNSLRISVKPGTDTLRNFTVECRNCGAKGGNYALFESAETKLLKLSGAVANV